MSGEYDDEEDMLPPIDEKESEEYKVGVMVDRVQIEGHVLLKIIKHSVSADVQQSPVVGEVVGIDRKNTSNGQNILQITHSFPLPPNYEEKKYRRDVRDYSEKIRVDKNIAGWYRSTTNGSFMTVKCLENQYGYQSILPQAVMLIYDSAFTSRGMLSIKAFQLTPKFMESWKNQAFTPTEVAAAELKSSELLREIPVQIHNSFLVHAFLYELSENNSVNCYFDRLHHSYSSPLGTSLKDLSETIDDYAQCSATFRRYWTDCSRRKKQIDEYKAKKVQDRLRNRSVQFGDLRAMFPEIPEPSRKDSIVVCSQMAGYAKKLESDVSQALAKMWLTQGLHHDEYL